VRKSAWHWKCLQIGGAGLVTETPRETGMELAMGDHAVAISALIHSRPCAKFSLDSVRAKEYSMDNF